MIPVQCKMARVALGLTIRNLADSLSMSPVTVSRFEAGEALKPRTVADIRRFLEDTGVIFIDENGGGAGVRLKKPGS